MLRGARPRERKDPVETRPLGATGLRVSALAFGTMTFGGGSSEFFRPIGDTRDAEARRIVDMCLDAGVNLFDSADGLSEEILGRALAPRREEALIATKLHARTGPGPNDLGASRHHVIAACEASLRRLGTDRIDLLQLHGFDALTPLEETLRALDDLVRAGKVRYIGCSNYSAWHAMKALGISEREGLERFACMQAYYSAAARDLEWELVPLALDQGLGVLVYSPLSGGLLSGKFRRGEEGPAGTRRVQMGRSPGIVDQDRAFDVVEALAAVAAKRGVSVAQAALAWVLRRPAVTSVILGARTPEQLADILGVADWVMSDEEVARVERAGRVPPPYPQWHQLLYNTARMAEPWMAEAAEGARPPG
jgi:aryl-alcohol dehydrogenase-like predicted oxidoreductase